MAKGGGDETLMKATELDRLRNAVKAKPSDADAVLELDDALQDVISESDDSSCDWAREEQFANLRQAFDSGCTERDVLARLANCATHRSEHEFAVAVRTVTATRDPSFASFSSLARSLHALGRTSEEIAALETARKFDDSNLRVCADLGAAYALSGDVAGAKKQLALLKKRKAAPFFVKIVESAVASSEAAGATGARANSPAKPKKPSPQNATTKTSSAEPKASKTVAKPTGTRSTKASK